MLIKLNESLRRVNVTYFIILICIYVMINDYLNLYNGIKAINKGKVINITDNLVRREIKNIELPLLGYYLQEPLSNILYNYLFKNLNIYLNVTKQTIAYLVTLFYALISIPQFFLLINTDKPYKRKLACLLFQFKNILDYTDGALSREFINETNDHPKNNYGHLADGIANALSAILFIAGSFIYIIRTEYKTKRNFGLKKDLLAYKLFFLIFFLIASIGWNFSLEYYTAKTVLTKVWFHVFSIHLFKSFFRVVNFISNYKSGKQNTAFLTYFWKSM